MSMVLIVRMMQQMQNYHPELSSQIRDHGEDIAPMPFIMF